MRSVLMVAAIAAALAGCADVDVPFNEREAEFIHRQGRGVVEGHAFFRAENGRVVYAAGEYVYLVPSTEYSDARMVALFDDQKYLKASYMFFRQMQSDPLYLKYVRSTKAESNGRFTFDKVAPGVYYVVTEATWTPENSILPSGGVIYERFVVTGQEKGPVKVIVSGK